MVSERDLVSATASGSLKIQLEQPKTYEKVSASEMDWVSERGWDWALARG